MYQVQLYHGANILYFLVEYIKGKYGVPLNKSAPAGGSFFQGIGNGGGLGLVPALLLKFYSELCSFFCAFYLIRLYALKIVNCAFMLLSIITIR